MSKDFIKAGFNSSEVTRAARQETQLTYFLESSLQETQLDQDYLTQWAERKFQTNDYFLNWVRLIFKEENFLTFFKYLRYPLASAKIIKNEIEPQLRRVFNAEDADFKYDVSGVELSDFADDLQIKKFNKKIFEKILYKHNSILVEDLDPIEPNKPFRYFVDVNDVVSILPCHKGIDKIAFRASIVIDDKIEPGVLYIDSFTYKFYDKDHVVIRESPHDLGRTPANFISPKKYKDSSIVRESLYTYGREELEEYVFLKTLRRMTEPNGVIPVTSMVDNIKKDDSKDVKGPELQPSSDNMMGSQHAKVFSQNEGQGTGDLQTGRIHYIHPDDIRNNDGSLNMDVVANWIQFHFIPTAPLEYIKTRINEIERSIKISIIGDVVESNEASKNELQIEKSISVLENNLTSLAEAFNRIRWKSDFDMLALKYGPKRVNEVFIHYGTDFFLDSQTKLFENFEKAPNALERKTIIVRINQNKYKNNIDQSSRQKLLYDLLPYCSDKDFEIARNTQTVGDINLQYQLRFNYWIGVFEARFGDIVTFWKNLDGELAEKLVLINNLIIEIIKEDELKSVSSANVES